MLQLNIYINIVNSLNKYFSIKNKNLNKKQETNQLDLMLFFISPLSLDLFIPMNDKNNKRNIKKSKNIIIKVTVENSQP